MTAPLYELAATYAAIQQAAEDGEKWRPILSHPHYCVSNVGRVRSHINSNGNQRKEPLILQPKTTHSYAKVTLCSDGCRETRWVHVLVLEAFCGPRPDGHYACHNNGVSTDNRLTNLRWGTPQDNADDRVRHGTQVRGDAAWSRRHPERVLRGSRVGNAKLTDELAMAIYVAKGKQRDIAKAFAVSQRLVGNIKRREYWAHIHQDGRT
jgi:hypothetical protein